MLEKVYCDMDPEEGVDEEYKSTKNPVLTWQLLRSISENDLTKFNNKDKNYDIEQLALEYLVPPYGLKEQSYFVKSKPKDEPPVEPKEEKLEVKESEKPVKNRKRSHSEQTDSKPEKNDDYKEPGTPKVQNEVKESRSSKLTKKPSDSHSQQELPKTSEPRIQKDSARKSPVEDQRKNVPADKPESRYEPREKERKPEKQRENPVYQSSRPRRDEHERGNKTTTTSTKDQSKSTAKGETAERDHRKDRDNRKTHK